MEKCLLDILLEEQDKVRTINSAMESIEFFQTQKETVREQGDISACDRIIANYKRKAEEASAELIEIRKGIKEYISWIMSL